MEKYTGQALNYPYTIRKYTPHRKNAEEKRFCEDILTFDIETTSFFYGDDNKPFLYAPGKDPDYWSEVNAGAIVWIWQFGINNKYYYGRDIKDFKQALDDLPKSVDITIWVHNLAFEWHFLDFLDWTDVFAKNTHKPMKCSCAEFPNITFRCSYFLENISLADWGKNLGLPKRVGDLEYNRLRTPLTDDITDIELGYCERDLEVIYLGITEELRTYKYINKIPLTATGKVRREAKDLLMSKDSYVNEIHKYVPETVYDYETSQFCYAGGYTHGNRTKVGRIFYNTDGKHGDHVDYCSSYPTEMLNKVPWGRWLFMDDELPDPSTYEDYGYKLHLVFHNIRAELQNTYIQISKCNCKRIRADNGRLLSAQVCDIWCTEQDFEIISLMYSWESLEVLEVWRADKKYLPKPYIEFMLKLFHDKSALKHVPGQEFNLRVIKGMLNGLYGMMVTSLLKSDITWDGEEWGIERLTSEMVAEHLEKLRRFKDKRYFLPYDAGVWVSNGSRARLFRDLIIPYDSHILYADTDSAFLDIYLDVTDINKRMDEHIKSICDERGLDFNLTRPLDGKGKQTCLGHLTHEDEWTEFKCLRAKTYCERWKEDGELHLTISGVNKSAVTVLKNDLNNFKDGLVFDKDDPDVDKLLHTYFDNQPDITFPDGYVSHQRRGVNLRPNSYKIKLDPDYKSLIHDMSTSMSVQFETHLRGIWVDEESEE